MNNSQFSVFVAPLQHPYPYEGFEKCVSRWRWDFVADPIPVSSNFVIYFESAMADIMSKKHDPLEMETRRLLITMNKEVKLLHPQALQNPDPLLLLANLLFVLARRIC